MDSLPYIDPPNDETYEEYALSLIQDEMNRRKPPSAKSPDKTGQTLRPTGKPLDDQSKITLSPSSSLQEHISELNRAKRAYEAERLRQLMLSCTNETPYKIYNEKIQSGWPIIASTQQAAVEEVNHQRKTYQESLQPHLKVAETQYQELVQKTLQLRSAIQDLQSELETE